MEIKGMQIQVYICTRKRKTDNDTKEKGQKKIHQVMISKTAPEPHSMQAVRPQCCNYICTW